MIIIEKYLHFIRRNIVHREDLISNIIRRLFFYLIVNTEKYDIDRERSLFNKLKIN
jgi:hypothetical protein